MPGYVPLSRYPQEPGPPNPDRQRWFTALVTAVNNLLSGTQVGSGSPEGVITADPGTLYRNTDGGALTSLYVKESGTGNTGWIPK